jgi:hypothetical protein
LEFHAAAGRHIKETRQGPHLSGKMNTLLHDNSTSKGDFIQSVHGRRPQKSKAVMGWHVAHHGLVGYHFTFSD